MILWTPPRVMYVTHHTTKSLALTFFRFLFFLSTAFALAPVGFCTRAAVIVAAAWPRSSEEVTGIAQGRSGFQ